MRFSRIEPCSVVDGEGMRVSLFVSGCRNHCPGCFNPETWDFGYGSEFGEIERNEVIEACRPDYIAGLTILGGDPMEEENQPELLQILQQLKSELPMKTVWLYTGYVLERDLMPGGRKHVDGVTSELLGFVDVIVDGPYVAARRDLTLKFRGSSNQRILRRKGSGFAVSCND